MFKMMFEIMFAYIKGMFAMIWFFLSAFLFISGIYLGLYLLIKIWKAIF